MKTIMAANYVVIPEEFRRSENSYCSQCRAETNGECGHFMDARDHHGPLEPMNWMIDSQLFNREEYLQWVNEHFNEIRFVQENPEFHQEYPDGSLGTIPFLRNLVEEK